MAGRHRATKKKSPSWRTPTVLGVAAAAVLVFSAWIFGGIWKGADTSGAALAVTAATTAPEGLRSTTTTRRTTRSTTSPTSTTTTVPPTTTTRSTTTVPKTTKKTTPKPPPPPPPPEECSTSLEGTQPHVAQVGNHVLTKFDVDSVLGVGDRSGSSDHPEGLALDFMVDSETGDALADYVLAHQAEFGVTYVIWSQRYNDGSGWSMMEDRGSATANHYDHVHVSFESGADVSVTC